MRRMAGQPKAAARGFAVNRLAYSELQAPLPATLKQAVPGPETGRMAAQYGPFEARYGNSAKSAVLPLLAVGLYAGMGKLPIFIYI